MAQLLNYCTSSHLAHFSLEKHIAIDRVLLNCNFDLAFWTIVLLYSILYSIIESVARYCALVHIVILCQYLHHDKHLGGKLCMYNVHASGTRYITIAVQESQCATGTPAIVQRWCKFIACRWLLNAHAHRGEEAMQIVLLQKHKLYKTYDNLHWNARKCSMHTHAQEQKQCKVCCKTTNCAKKTYEYLHWNAMKC